MVWVFVWWLVAYLGVGLVLACALLAFDAALFMLACARTRARGGVLPVRWALVRLWLRGRGLLAWRVCTAVMLAWPFVVCALCVLAAMTVLQFLDDRWRASRGDAYSQQQQQSGDKKYADQNDSAD